MSQQEYKIISQNIIFPQALSSVWGNSENKYFTNKLKELINKNNYDIYINNIGFHNSILDIWFDRKVLDMKDFEELSTSNLGLLKDLLYGKDNVKLVEDNKKPVVALDNFYELDIACTQIPTEDIIDNNLQLYIFQDKYTLGLNDIFRESCSMDLFLYLLEFSHDRFLVNNIGYNVRNQKTPRIVDVLYPEYFKLYLLVLENKSELRKILQEAKDPKNINLYAYMIGEGGEKDLVEARRLYKLNWEENKNSSSLNNYAHMLQHGEGGGKNSEEARKLYKLNWEENKHIDSLNNYAYMLQHGEGGEKDLVEARRLYKLNWEENKNSRSLHNYAYMIDKGEGGEKNLEEARRLFKLNWEENRHITSLYNYAYMLQEGEGGEKNLEEAQLLFAIHKSLN